MEIKEVQDHSVWNEFVKKYGPRSGAFLQSWEWGEFEMKSGLKIFRYGLYSNGALTGVCQISLHSLPFGFKYTACSRGPIFSDSFSKEGLDKMTNFLKTKHNILFFRFEPTSGSSKDLIDPKIKPSVTLSPKHTLIMDLDKSEDEILSQMHSKTRYNVRLAERKGVKVVELGLERFEEAWSVFSETSERDQFKLHSKKHYHNMISSFPSGDVQVRLVGAEYKGKVIAANIMVDFAGTRTYLHGASSNEHRNVMAPYALHWSEIKQAKEKAVDFYDWWGISDDNKAWAGITRFKRGFGGEEIQYAGTFDKVVSSTQYKLYSLARRVLYGTRH